MAYIIENANILKDHGLLTKSILIKENRIDGIQNSFKQYRFMKMNAEPFILTPSYVLLDTKLPLASSFQQFKAYMVEHFLLKGCTTLLMYVNVSFQSELSKKVNELKTALISSPIDFLIGVRIPLKLVTPQFIRICKKERIPAIFVEVKDKQELEAIPWSWIREALFPYNSPLVPIFLGENRKSVKESQKRWTEILLKEKIPALFEEMEENVPLSAAVLNKIGIYSKKSSLNHGAEVSYNLYVKSKEINNVDTKQLFLYHSDRLVITVQKGKIVRAGKEVQFKPGNGEYVKVVTPAYFSFS
ncbi:hypothetical protein ACF5W4_11565 [Bacillota bacterium Lsc_1132]